MDVIEKIIITELGSFLTTRVKGVTRGWSGIEALDSMG